MKIKTKLLSMILTILLIFSIGMPVYASSSLENDSYLAEISESASAHTYDIDAASEEHLKGFDLENQENENNTQGEASSQGSNAPFFIGAIISVLLFIGVALYCKFNGNKN